MKKIILFVSLVFLWGSYAYSQEWEKISGGTNLDGFQAHPMIIDNGVLYVSSYGVDLYRAENLGNPDGPLWMNLETTGVGAMAIDPNDPEKLWYGSSHFYESLAKIGNLSPVRSGLPPLAQNEYDTGTGVSTPYMAWCIAVDYEDSSRILAGRTGDIVLSIDGGNTWTEIAGSVNMFPREIVQSPVSPHLFYAATREDGIYVYDKITGNFSHFGLTGRISDIEFDCEPGQEGNFYAAADSGDLWYYDGAGFVYMGHIVPVESRYIGPGNVKISKVCCCEEPIIFMSSTKDKYVSKKTGLGAWEDITGALRDNELGILALAPDCGSNYIYAGTVGNSVPASPIIGDGVWRYELCEPEHTPIETSTSTFTHTYTQIYTSTPTETPTYTPIETTEEFLCFVTKWGSRGNEDGEFESPQGIATDNNGYIYIVDTYNYRIQKFDSDGNYITQWGNLGSQSGQFIAPFGVAVDDLGNVYVADTFNYRIQKFDSDGSYITQWGSEGSGDGQFAGPYGITVDGLGNVYVTDPRNYRIQKFDLGGNYITQWGNEGTGDGEFGSINGIAADSMGNVYIADTYNHRIQKFDSDGNYITQWGNMGSQSGQFIAPFGVAVDGLNNVYVADTVNSRIQVFTLDGEYLGRWGSYGNGDGQFYRPRGVTADDSGYVYVVDYSRNDVQKFGPCEETPTHTSTGTFTYTYTQTHTSTPTDTPTYTPTPTATPFATHPEIVEIKDKGIDWLHTMQFLHGVPPEVYGAWGYNNNRWGPGCVDNGNNVVDTANVAMTSLAVLALLNEGHYPYFNDITTLPVSDLVTGLSIDDPAIPPAIEYILRNSHITRTYASGAQEGPISDWDTAANIGGQYNTYNTSCALVALSAYRRVARVTGRWDPSDPFHRDIERAMQRGWLFLMNNQTIEYNPAGPMESFKLNTDFDPHSYDSSSCHYGGWGYPRHHWADMSNTQFAVWALDVVDIETRNYDVGDDNILPDGNAAPLTAPGTGNYPVLEFYGDRRTFAYEFIKGSNESPENLPPNEYVESADGGLYGICEYEPRNLHNDGCPYGSITAAGLWSLYSVNRPWKPDPPIFGFNPSDPVAWNEMLWLEAFHTPLRNPVNPDCHNNIIHPERWYYYYMMTFMKAMLMNGAGNLNSPIPGWYETYRNRLVDIVSTTGCVPPEWPYPGGELHYWSNDFDERETDVYATIFSILGIETALGRELYNPDMAPHRLYIQLLSPAELLVLDDDGLKTGCEEGINLSQIEDSSFTGCGTEPQTAVIDWPGGVYTVRIKALEDAVITVRAATDFYGNPMSEYSRELEVQAGGIYEYTVSVGNVYWPMTLSVGFVKGVQPVSTPEVTFTATPTVTATLTPEAPLPAQVSMTFKSGDISLTTTSPHPQFRVENTGDADIDLSGLEIRYWYKYEGTGQSEQAHIDYAGKLPGGTNIGGETSAEIISGDFGDEQDRYLKVVFGAGAGSIGPGETVKVDTRFNKTDWSHYQQGNDWSFYGVVDYTVWDKAAVYADGVLVWGEEPGSNIGTLSKTFPVFTKPAEGISESNTYNYPNPCSTQTLIRFSLAAPAEVKMIIYDTNGRPVWSKNLNTGETRRGINHIVWDLKNDLGMDAANGIYMLRVFAEEKVITKKIAVIR